MKNLNEQRLLHVADKLAKRNILDVRRMIQEGYTQEEIKAYLERKSYHTMNMIFLYQNGKNWTAYPNLEFKARRLAGIGNSQ